MRVIKVGGNELDDPGFVQGFAGAIAQIRARAPLPLVVVHGGGQAIAALQSRLGLQTIKVDGLRVTDGDSLAAAEMVLSGHSNKLLVRALLAAGVDALGLSGVDAGLLRCRKKLHHAQDLGYVGEVVEIRASLLQQLAALDLVTVLSPISLGLDGHTYNVNADEVAGAVALALGAQELDFVSNVPGVLHEGAVLPRLSAGETEQLIAQGFINGGMIPKVRAALAALQRGVPRVRIVDLPGLTHEAGTLFADLPATEAGSVP